MTDRAIQKRFGDLLGGEEAGAYTLPGEIAESLGAVARMSAGLQEAAHRLNSLEANPHLAEAALTDGAMAAAVSGGPMPSADGVLAALRAQEGAGAQVRAFVDADRRCRDRVGVLIRDLAPQILTEHLCPALTEVIQTARKLVKPLAGVASAEDAVAAGPKAASLWMEAVGLAGRYLLIRRGYGSIRQALGFGDASGYFDELKDIDSAWPDFRQGLVAAPWPEDATARFLWICANATPWLPTAADVEAEMARLAATTAPAVAMAGGGLRATVT